MLNHTALKDTSVSERERERERQRETERDRERQRETERDRVFGASQSHVQDESKVPYLTGLPSLGVLDVD